MSPAQFYFHNPTNLEVEVCSECYEDEYDGNEKAGGHPGRHRQPAVGAVELDPGDDHDLHQEEQDAQHGAEAPGKLDDLGHLLVGRLEDRAGSLGVVGVVESG